MAPPKKRGPGNSAAASGTALATAAAAGGGPAPADAAAAAKQAAKLYKRFKEKGCVPAVASLVWPTLMHACALGSLCNPCLRCLPCPQGRQVAGGAQGRDRESAVCCQLPADVQGLRPARE
jgi:hypothetical protein